MTDAFSYDTVAYPTTTFPQTFPDRLALHARLHGLTAPPIETARVMEIGGGDGFNSIALAAAWPKAQFYNFDLSAEAVARGQELVRTAGLTNIRIEQADILDVARTVEPGSYDYIVTHGVYAWVPEIVQEAIMAIVGRALSPEGVFFVSFNSMPGGHIRRIMRDMLLHELEGIENIEERMRTARAFLTDHAEPRDGDDIVVRAMRAQSKSMLTRPDSVLFHDEMGACFEPQYLSDVAAKAAAHGLEFLGDSGANRMGDGFLPPEIEASPDEATALTLRRAQTGDFAEMRFFRQCLFVRAGRGVKRQPVYEVLRDCHGVAQFQADPEDEGGIKVGDAAFKLRDEDFTRRLLELGDAWPAFKPIDKIALDEEQLEAIHRLYSMSYMYVATAPAPFLLDVTPRPVASPLVRAQIALGRPQVTTLHFEAMQIEDASARTLLSLLDGTRTMADLEPVWAASEHPADVDLLHALASCAARRLLIG